ncbi:MAG: SDR family oxidoreductase [Rectinemataceae bacterium]
MRTRGNTIVITGGTSGIGLGLAERFLALGNRVIVCGRREERLAAIRARLSGLVALRYDMAEEKQRVSFARRIAEEYPAANVLVNNAGIQLVTDLTKPLDMARVRDELEINLLAPLHLGSLFAQQLSGKEGAAVVNVSSGLAFAPIAAMPVYCAGKAAVHSLSLSMRRQFRDLGIKVYEIAPPSVDSELGKERRPQGGTHGGLPVAAFVDAVIAALEAETFEIALEGAEGLREGRESLFDRMNP